MTAGMVHVTAGMVHVANLTPGSDNHTTNCDDSRYGLRKQSDTPRE
jgi:hypothetical protein